MNKLPRFSRMRFALPYMAALFFVLAVSHASVYIMFKNILSGQAGVIPIVAMTANVFRDDVERCLEAGMNAHIGKPLNVDEIIDILRRYLRCT